MGVHIVRDDVQHALVAVGRRSEAGIQLEQTTGVRLDLQMADLQKLLLTDSNLNGAISEGENPSHARLYGVDFSDADFRYANVQSTFFLRSSFNDAMFDGVDLSHSAFNLCGREPALDLSPNQSIDALAAPDHRPDLRGVIDPATDKQMEWPGKDRPPQTI